MPGTAGLEHRIGGIEKADGTGNISYDPANHDFMVRTRQAKIDGIAATIPPLEVDDPSGEARVLVLGWGSTYGPIGAACRLVRTEGGRVAQAHLRHLNPFPADLGEVLGRYEKVLIPEMNLGYGYGGQLTMLVRAKYLVDALGYNQVRGLPFKAEELAIGDHQLRRRHHQRGAVVSTTPGPQGFPALDLVPKARETQSAKDFKTDQEVRWCPGCGDYAILAAVQCFMPELGLARENIVFVSGHRLLVAVPVLHGHLRDALHPRPGPGHRHRAGRLPAGPVGVGRHR